MSRRSIPEIRAAEARQAEIVRDLAAEAQRHHRHPLRDLVAVLVSRRRPRYPVTASRRAA